MKKSQRKSIYLILHLIQAIIALIFFSGFRILPLRIASGFGGWLGRTIGPQISLSRRATKNLSRVFPEKSSSEIKFIVRGMWDNLGRLAGEYPHLSKLNVYDPKSEIEVIGAEFIDQLRDDKKPGVFFSAHMGNWEIIPLCGSQRGLPIDRVYRAANNRLVEWLYRQGRGAAEGALIPKGPQGIRLLLRSFREGQHLGVLMDQKMNDGICVPFFGINSMTTSAIADLVLRFDCPIVPVHIERLGGVKFRIIFEPPLRVLRVGDQKEDIYALMVQINNRIEEWVRANPEQWLWLHNRWSN